MLVLTCMSYIYNKFFIFLVTQYLHSPWEVLYMLRINISLKPHGEGEKTAGAKGRQNN